MTFKSIHYFCVSTLLMSSLSLGQDLNPDDQVAQVVRMTARKYEFSPSQIHVKLGVKVRLKITAIDRDHGLTIVREPVGDDSSPHPGLVFTSSARGDGWRLNKGKE